MDAHFDSSMYHPTFLQDWNTAQQDFFDTSFSHFMQMAHEHSLPYDIVDSALHKTWDFLEMTAPTIINSSETCMYGNSPYTMQDDVLGLNLDQLKTLGIRDENSLSLICTHEAGHRITQFLAASNQISPWECEVYSDALMGFRAAADGLDTTAVEKSFTQGDSNTHPGEDIRHRYIQYGKDIYKFLQENNQPLTIDNYSACLSEYLSNDSELHQRELAAATGITGSLYNQHLAYTQSEINAKIHEYENKIDHYKNVIRENEEIARYKAAHGQAHSSNDYSRDSAKIDLENAKRELDRWKNETPQ